MKIAEIRFHSVVDGPGVRTAVLFQGCPHHCKGCYSKSLWASEGGVEMSIGDVLCAIGRGLDSGDGGVTLTGGDPLAQPQSAAKLCAALRDAGVHTIVYTGFSCEELVAASSPEIALVLEAADVLVDGPYIQALHDPRLPYRGSTNQRIIDLAASRRARTPVLLDWEREEPISILPEGDVVINLHRGTARLVRALGKAVPYLNCGQGRRR